MHDPLQNLIFKLKFFRISLVILSSVFLISCGIATLRPKQEMSYAAAAFLAAKRVKAPQFAPQFYRKAELYYLKAKSAYKRKYFNKAKQYAILSRRFSEKAEFKAIREATLNAEEEK